MSYVELHAHSAYSFLDGASRPEELAARAAELGYPALALTDHDGVYGSLEFAPAPQDLGGGPITRAEGAPSRGGSGGAADHRRRGDAEQRRLDGAAQKRRSRFSRDAARRIEQGLRQSVP